MTLFATPKTPRFFIAMVAVSFPMLGMMAGAATLVKYVDGTAPAVAADPPPPAVTAAGLMASTLTGVSNGGPLGTAGSPVRREYGATNQAAMQAAFTTTTPWTLMSAAGRDGGTTTPPTAAALTTDYFVFTLTLDPGATMTLDQLTFDLAVVSNAGAVTTAWGLQVYASVNGGAYATVGSALNIASTDYTVGTATRIASQQVDLSSLNSGPAISTVSFRVWQGSDLNTDSTLALAYQNITVTGTAIVPEPSTALLAAAAAGMGMMVRRRR